MNIATAKLELIEWIAKSDDEQLLEQMFDFFLQKKELRQQIAVKELLMQRAKMAENDIENGNVYSDAEMEKMIASW